VSDQGQKFARFCLPLIALAALLLAAFFVVEFAAPARALPSYARQTGQPCGTCHTDFAGLTPYGRRFKIGGYTAGGGQYRTTLFPFDNSTGDYQRPWVPPISMMATLGFTHTATDMGPPADPFAPNNNITIPPLSFFWGGAITDHIGAFAQVTYDQEVPAASIGANPFIHAWHWDNVDVRYADSTTLGKMNITYGITANNNPTVQDPWNTTPAWGFPYAASPFWPGFGPAAPLIDGGFGQTVGSVGGYVYINDLIYLEMSVYRSLSPSATSALGIDPTGLGLINAAPYWRAAIEPHWGPHWLEVGTFGMIANVHPFVGLLTGTLPGASPLAAFDTSTFPQTDKYTDIGFDAQYQYQGSNFWFTLRGTYIHEQQKLDASFNLLGAANLTNELNEARAYASLAYGNNNRVVLTGQYFTTWGSPNLLGPGLGADTKGWIAEIAYIPFISSFSPGWPWFNARIGLQYTWYQQFGSGTACPCAPASNNNTLFAYIWLAM
jgi:hypothetical protein